jgi:hypothetical protein
MTSARDLQFKSVNYTGLGQGPRLIVTGAVHGNETCGTKAIRRVMEELDSGKLLVSAGSVTFVPVVNPLAYAKGERSGDRNPTATCSRRSSRRISKTTLPTGCARCWPSMTSCSTCTRSTPPASRS